MAKNETMRAALAAWEIGRAASGFGAKAGGLGVVLEELPPELVAAAARQDVALEVVTLSPCFAHYDRSELRPLDVALPVVLDGHEFSFRAYSRTFEETVAFPDGERTVALEMVYFWDEGQLGWTDAKSLYPNDAGVALRLFAATCQAMARYVEAEGFDVVHLHDYHVGLLPFYLSDEALERTSVHLTVHNASYQGDVPVGSAGFDTLSAIGLDGPALFGPYFDHFGGVNPMKAALLKVHELGGRVTTVSGDLDGTWGYAAELRQSEADVRAAAREQKGSEPAEVFVSNRNLDAFQRVPVAGITNGLRDKNRPENNEYLHNEVLWEAQAKRAGKPLFSNPAVQAAMMARDHRFDAERLEVKAELKRLLFRQCFGREPGGDPIIMVAIGRLVEQKNFELVAECITPLLGFDTEVFFCVLASPNPGDDRGEALERRFRGAATMFPQRVFFSSAFDPYLAKLMLAGGDFALIPSRFEPCGLVDYEASLMGTVAIARRTGGLAKIDGRGYLYDWLDAGDRYGEELAFADAMRLAIKTYRKEPERHEALLRAAMEIPASWGPSAEQYIDLYRYGVLVKRWRAARREFARRWAAELGPERDAFARWFRPGTAPDVDPLDTALYSALK